MVEGTGVSPSRMAAPSDRRLADLISSETGVPGLGSELPSTVTELLVGHGSARIEMPTTGTRKSCFTALVHEVVGPRAALGGAAELLSMSPYFPRSAPAATSATSARPAGSTWPVALANPVSASGWPLALTTWTALPGGAGVGQGRLNTSTVLSSIPMALSRMISRCSIRLAQARRKCFSTMRPNHFGNSRS